ncbi:MAG: iron uptake porin [Rivularia sp. (in: Bacteria)]|nr:iron uptake porin [Rivularia sp. MS3]
MIQNIFKLSESNSALFGTALVMTVIALGLKAETAKAEFVEFEDSSQITQNLDNPINFQLQIQDASQATTTKLADSQVSQHDITSNPKNKLNLSNSNILPVEKLAQAEKKPAKSQVTSVSQLSDVQPTDWAFAALQSLVERYGCIAGYPNGTYRGNRALTRYEFAAGLNACLDRVNELIATATADIVSREDLATLQRLQEEFAAELATLRGRVDALEARTAELEANQFSTTTKLQGEAAFTLAGADGDDVDAEIVFNERIRLQLVSSFTGKDKLFTRLTTGNIGNSFVDEIGTNEGRFAFDGPGTNDLVIDRLHYVFPVGDKLKVTAMASLGAHHFYADVLNSGLNTGGGATGAMSRFAERNPIYRLGIARSTTGIGFSYKLADAIKIEGGYLAKNGSDPDQKAGLFNGNYSAMGQLVFQPIKRFKLGLTYINGYDPGDGTFAFGGTGTNFANGLLPGTEERRINSNSYGVQAQLDLSSKFSIRGWGSYTDVDFNGGSGDAEIWNYALALVFPDLGKKGGLGAIIAGAEPYAGDISPRPANFENDTPLHIEAMYRYPINDNISITPGVIWLKSPNQNEDNEDVFIGALRTTFTF